MKVPVSWLRELVPLPEDLDVATLAARFTNLGLTVEHIESTGPTVSGPLTVGRVLSFTEEPQKNGKTIRYCRVDVGEEHNDDASDEFPASRGIVCGASNFAVGDLVVVALPGTVLPGDFEISARKTYGHISDGMICAEDELGLGEDHEGIMILDPHSGAQPGDDALKLLWSDDVVLELDVTPDLGYCMSMRGIAREAGVASGVGFVDPYGTALPQPSQDGYPVKLESERCLNFVALTIEGIDPSATTPAHIVKRLRACGVRSISLPVDITNYVMLESGQPLHAYDADKLRGPIRVRMAQAGEQITTLDGQDRDLDLDDLVIADDSGAIGIAGVMGGESTEVSEETTTIVLEAAHFQPASVSRTFRRHGLPSEASKRFERAVDPQLPYAAAQNAARLIARYGGGAVSEAITVAGAAPERLHLNLQIKLISAVLGTQVPTSEILRILDASGIPTTAMGDAVSLVIPSWRTDLREPYDIVEEVGRKFGYHNIGLTMPTPPPGGGLTKRQRDRRRAVAAVVQLGFTELLTLPFLGEPELDKLGLPADDARRRTVLLANPLSEAAPNLRSTLLPGLFATLAKNTSRSIDDIAVFERGMAHYHSSDQEAPRPSVSSRPSDEELAQIERALPRQVEAMAAVVAGNWLSAGWYGPAIKADWTHVVAFAEAAARAVGVTISREQETERMPWHPGRCARLVVDGQVIGYAGEVHPHVVRAYELPARTCAVEFNLSALLAAAPGTGRIAELSGFPVAKEDVALIVDRDVPAADVEQALREGAGPLLEEIRLFDVYEGEQAGKGKKSLAFALRFRGQATLTDAEAAEARQAAVDAAAEKCGGVQRVVG